MFLNKSKNIATLSAISDRKIRSNVCMIFVYSKIVNRPLIFSFTYFLYWQQPIFLTLSWAINKPVLGQCFGRPNNSISFLVINPLIVYFFFLYPRRWKNIIAQQNIHGLLSKYTRGGSYIFVYSGRSMWYIISPISFMNGI